MSIISFFGGEWLGEIMHGEWVGVCGLEVGQGCLEWGSGGKLPGSTAVQGGCSGLRDG